MGSRQKSRSSEFGAGFINEAMSIVARELPQSKWAAKKLIPTIRIACCRMDRMRCRLIPFDSSGFIKAYGVSDQ